MNSHDILTSIRWALIAVMSLFALLYVPVVYPNLDEGKSALKARRFNDAKAKFEAELEAARVSDDTNAQANAHFYLGLTLQQRAKAASESEKEPQLLLDAETHYKEAIALKPNFGPALNNLAKLYADHEPHENSHELATENFRKAIALDDARKPLYLFNYAEFLARKAQPSEAIKFYKQVIELQPNNERAHQRLFTQYLTLNPRTSALAYLWQLINQGQVIRAQTRAIEALKENGWLAGEKKELLTVIVVLFSEQYDDPQEFLGSEIAKTLETLQNDASLQEGIDEIFRLYRGQHLRLSNYPWWSGSYPLNEDPPRGVWHTEGFQKLIRARGRWCQDQGQTEKAESYYRLAAQFRGAMPDPEAYLDLAELYISTNNLDKLRQLIDQSEVEIFKGKGEAYRNSEVRKIYRYHLALGTIYARLNRWGDSTNPTSAIFQLEHAQKAAEWYNSKESRGDELVIDPRATNLLAEGYVHKGRESEALRTYETSLQFAQDTGDQPAEAQTWLALGKVYETQGQHGESLTAYRNARGIYEQRGDVAAVEQVENAIVQTSDYLDFQNNLMQAHRGKVGRDKRWGWGSLGVGLAGAGGAIVVALASDSGGIGPPDEGESSNRNTIIFGSIAVVGVVGGIYFLTRKHKEPDYYDEYLKNRELSLDLNSDGVGLRFAKRF